MHNCPRHLASGRYRERRGESERERSIDGKKWGEWILVAPEEEDTELKQGLQKSEQR